MPLTPAEKMRRRRQKLKDEGRYEEYKAIHRQTEKRSYENRKKALENLPAHKREAELAKIRERNRIKVAKHRQQKRKQKLPTSNSPAYKTAASLGRAVARVKGLPKSPRKKKVVVRKLFESSFEIPKKPRESTRPNHQNAISEETIKKVVDFYEREDVSRQAPGIKDVITVRNSDGTKEKKQTRHLCSSVMETHALFCSEHGEIIGKSKFAMLRPQHVLLSNKMPHNVCLCKYHENYISAVDSFHKIIPDFPSYNNSFLESIMCENATESCWLGTCKTCSSSIRIKLNDAIEKNDAPAIAKWNVWVQNEGKLSKTVEEGSVHELAEHIINMTANFLEHSFIKRNQAKSYQEHREASDIPEFNAKLAMFQVDFSENYTCIAQDEVQSFHWVQPQVSLLTVSLWHSGKHHPLTIVSDNLDHGKETVVAYIDRILEEIPEAIEDVYIWSDGPSSQFKNRFITASLAILEKRHNLRIM